MIKNDRERELWVSNEESLWNWYRSSRQSMREFIRANREELDEIISRALGESQERSRKNV
jgi:hypothetical protein